MTPDMAKESGVTGADITKSGSAVGVLSDLPSSFPAWAKQLAELYFSGTTSAFVLYGNTYDFVRCPGRDGEEFVGLAEFLAEQLFGRWSLVLHYDLGRGLRVAAGRTEQRLKEMVALANRKVGDLSTLSKEPSAAIALLDRFVRNNLMAAEADRLSVAVVVDQASYVFPSGDPGRLSPQASSQLVTLLNWATSPHVKRINMAFVLVDEKRADLSERLTGNPHVASIEVPLPSEPERVGFVNATVDAGTLKAFSDYDAAQLAALTAG